MPNLVSELRIPSRLSRLALQPLNCRTVSRNPPFTKIARADKTITLSRFGPSRIDTKADMADYEESVPQCPFDTPNIHITSHNAEGKAKIHSTRNEKPEAPRGSDVVFNVAYTTSRMPVDLNDEKDILEHNSLMSEPGKLGLVRKNGTVLRFVDFAPGNTSLMHRTQSLDYGVVIQGEMIMDLDDGSETRIKCGDVVIQRSTMHGWRNASDTQWARMLFMLQDCLPVMVGGERYKEHLPEHVRDILSSGNDN